MLGAGDRAGRACSMTRSPRTSAERSGLRGSAARRLPGRHQPRASGPPCTGPATGIMRPRTRSLDRPTLAAGPPADPDELRAYAVRPPPEGPMTSAPAQMPAQIKQICMLTTVIVQSRATAPNGGYFVSCDGRAVTVCNEDASARGRQSEVPGEPVAASRSRCGERRRVIVNTVRGLRSGPSDCSAFMWSDVGRS